MIKTLYCSKLLIDGTGNPPIVDGAVCTENGRILSVGKQNDFGADFEGRKIGLGDQTLLPGLIDCHNHICMDASIPNWPSKFDIGDIELTLRAIRNMNNDLQTGVTLARCPGDRSFIDLHCKQAVDSGSLTGPRLLVATRGIRATHGHGLIGYAFDGVETVRRVVRENVKAGADLIKLFLTGTVPADPIICYPSREEIRVAVEEAHRAGLPVTAHCIGGSALDLCLDLGIDCVEHGYFLTEKQIERLVNSGTWLVLTPSPYLSDEWQSTLPPSFAAGFRNGRETAAHSMTTIINSGIKYAVGSDGLHGRLSQDINYLVQLGATQAEALAAATRQAAKVCGMINQVGTLEVGKYADMIGVTGNPLSDISALDRVQTVITRGKIKLQKCDIIDLF